MVSIAQDNAETQQDTIPKKNIEVQDIEVIKAFEARLIDAQKVGVKPQIQPVIPVDKKYNYAITIVPLELEYEDPIIKPLAMDPDPDKNVNNGYAKLGYGLLNSPYADASYQYVKGDELDLIIHGHLYGLDDSDNVVGRKFLESNLGAELGYRVGENHLLNVEVDGNYDQRNLYDTLFTQQISNLDLIKRNLFDFTVSTQIKNIEATDAGFTYHGKLAANINGVDEQINASETTTSVDLGVAKQWSDQFKLYLETHGEAGGLSYGDSTSQRYLATVQPGILWTLGNFKMDASADLLFDQQAFSPFSDITLGYTLLNQSIEVVGGIAQDYIGNTLNFRLNDNPFSSTNLDNTLNTITQRYFGGVKGNIKDFVSFEFYGGYKSIKNQGFYVFSSQGYKDVVFDDANALYFNANIDFKINDQVKVGGIVNQNFYDTEVITEVYNLPEYEYQAYANVNFWDQKINWMTALVLTDQITYLNSNLEPTEGNTQLDLSTEIQFYPTSKFGLWIRANNILDREYLRYGNYPQSGRNLLGGLIVKF